MENKIKYSIAIVIIIITSIITYWYFNPTISNKDFHLEYEVSNSNENFYNARDTNVSEEKYTFNNEIYYNKVSKYRLTLYSLDFSNKGERIIIVTDYSYGKNKRVANITYKDRLGNFSPIIIHKDKDSVFIIQNLENVSNNNIIFEGKK